MTSPYARDAFDPARGRRVRTDRKKAPRSELCRCDGRYEGCTHGHWCGRPGGGHRSPWFCDVCDPRRIDHISANLREIQRDFAARSR